MSLLSACSDAAILLNQTEPAAIFSNTDQFAKELRVIANIAAEAIMSEYDWRALTKRATITGDGVTKSFTLPSDYDRMVKKTNLASSATNIDLVPARDLDQWDYFQNHMSSVVPGYWIVLGGFIQINPAPGNGVVHSYYYVSNNVVAGNKAKFTADADTLVLPERLLTLSLVWRWRQTKRMEYAEDLRNFELALEEEIAADRGSRVLVSGAPRSGYDVRTAYPGPLGS